MDQTPNQSGLVPPSSSRVSIRTMQTDVSSMSQTGGISTLPDYEDSPVSEKQTQMPSPPAGKKSTILWWILGTAFIAVLLFLFRFIVLPAIL